jgi:DNA invertase Pin-like site-specific DNA recombinase
MKPTCCIIVRVSTSRQETQRQITELQEVATQFGWEVVSVLEETVSGNASLEERPSLSEALQMANGGIIGRVLVHEVSRLSRKPSLIHSFVESLESHGVSLYWHAQRVETLLPNGKRNPSAAIMLALLAEMARAERDTLIERINSGLRAAKDKGVRLGRPPGHTIPAHLRYAEAAAKLKGGDTVKQVAQDHRLSEPTVWRIKASMSKSDG